MRDRKRGRLVRRGRQLFVGALAVLAGCESPVAYEYGVEVEARHFTGHVIDGDTGDPIPGIQVAFEGATAITGQDGAWSVSGNVPDGCHDACTITATDIDGADNGVYHDHAVDVGDEDAVDQDATDIIIEMDPLEDTGG